VDPDQRADLERPIRYAHEAGDFDAAATGLLELYGDELARFLAALARTPDDAADAYAQLCEDLWRGLPSFAFRSSVRTWSYTLARNALYRLARAPAKRADRNVPLSREEQVTGLIARAREATAAYRRTTIKDRFAALRDSLPTDDRELLILRVDRGLDWAEIARVTDSEDAEPDAARIKRRAASLRKRFERLKLRLAKLARDEGLVPSE
jgi:RNA polymerase sigma-70 factor (ECF subfamily)